MARAATHSGSDTTGWGRARLLGILTTAVVMAACLLGGVAYAAYLALNGVSNAPATSETATGGSARATVPRGDERRNAIAESAMLRVPPEAAFPAEPTNRKIPPIEVPPGTGISGPSQVMTGFPQTPEGAIGQLAQIDIAVLQAMSLPTAEQVYATWALPGGVAADDWWVTASVNEFLSSTQMGQVKDPDAAITVEPVAALVKGTDGPGWTTVCVLLKVSATYRQNGQVAFGHCERMQWVGGRWMLAPGPPPAPAPSTWPGTELARRAGWHMWFANHAGRSYDGSDLVRSQDR